MSEFEDQPLDALRRFIDLASRAKEKSEPMEEDADRLQEVFEVFKHGHATLVSCDPPDDFDEWVEAMFIAVAHDDEGKHELSKSMDTLGRLVEFLDDTYAAYQTLIDFVFKLGLGFGSYEYRREK